MPFLAIDSTVCFSAYGLGWGYFSFALCPRTVCEKLGASDEDPTQLLLSFELGKQRILDAIVQREWPHDGGRILLASIDL
ncbi:hypothetical protein DIE21_15270 [Burkholderia sp. Bp9140]|nr:hypothetical protein DIE21_15270 [Burkholderia sp. Bp9140]